MYTTTLRIRLWALLLLSATSATAQPLQIKRGYAGGKKVGLENSAGKLVVKQKYIQIADFVEQGFFLAIDKNLEIEQLDPETGKIIRKGKGLKLGVLPSLYDQPSYRANGSKTPVFKAPYLVLTYNGKAGLYNFQLEKISGEELDEIRVDTQKPQYLYVRKGWNWGLMNEKGEITITPQYISINRGIFPENYSFGYPTENLFRVSDRQQTYYVNNRNEIDYAASAELCCQVKGETDQLERRAFLMLHIDKLKGKGKTLLAKTYNSRNDSTDNLAEAYRWYLEAWQEESSSQFALVSLAEFLKAHKDFPFVDAALNWKDLFRIAAISSPAFYNDLAMHYYFQKQLDSAKFYFGETIRHSDRTGYLQIPANLGLARIFKAEGNSELAAKHLNDATTAARHNQVKISDYDLADIGIQLVRNLQYGQVVLYKGEKVMVLHETSAGRALSNGKNIPYTATDFKVLNESTDQFMTKCLACAGTGVVSKTYKMGYTPSISRSEIVSGSTVSGDYIKTSTYTAPSTYQGTENCRVCYGTKKVVKKHP